MLDGAVNGVRLSHHGCSSYRRWGPFDGSDVELVALHDMGCLGLADWTAKLSRIREQLFLMTLRTPDHQVHEFDIDGGLAQPSSDNRASKRAAKRRSRHTAKHPNSQANCTNLGRVGPLGRKLLANEIGNAPRNRMFGHRIRTSERRHTTPVPSQRLLCFQPSEAQSASNSTVRCCFSGHRLPLNLAGRRMESLTRIALTQTRPSGR